MPSYEAFLAAKAQLEAAGRLASYSNLQERIGGSTRTIKEYRQRWEREQAQPTPAPPDDPTLAPEETAPQPLPLTLEVLIEAARRVDAHGTYPSPEWTIGLLRLDLLYGRPQEADVWQVLLDAVTDADDRQLLAWQVRRWRGRGQVQWTRGGEVDQLQGLWDRLIVAPARQRREEARAAVIAHQGDANARRQRRRYEQPLHTERN